MMPDVDALVRERFPADLARERGPQPAPAAPVDPLGDLIHTIAEQMGCARDQ